MFIHHANIIALFRLDTDMQRGLSEEEVKKRRAVAGWNELEAKRENMFVKFLSFFTVSSLSITVCYIADLCD